MLCSQQKKTKNKKHNNVKLKTCRHICNTLLTKYDIMISLELITTMLVRKKKLNDNKLETHCHPCSTTKLKTSMMLNSQCVVMALVVNKQKKFTTIMTLELIVTIVRQQKLKKN